MEKSWAEEGSCPEGASQDQGEREKRGGSFVREG